MYFFLLIYGLDLILWPNKSIIRNINTKASWWFGEMDQ